MNKLISFIQLHWVAITAFAMAFWTQYSQPIADWVHNHPHYTIIFSVLSFTISYYLRSPINRGGNQPAAIGFPKP